jgi:hypothetical protein
MITRNPSSGGSGNDLEVSILTTAVLVDQEP